VWLAPYWEYALGPLRGLQIQRLIRRVEGYERNRTQRPARGSERFEHALSR
jgi:hypothetical protein